MTDMTDRHMTKTFLLRADRYQNDFEALGHMHRLTPIRLAEVPANSLRCKQYFFEDAHRQKLLCARQRMHIL